VHAVVALPACPWSHLAGYQHSASPDPLSLQTWTKSLVRTMVRLSGKKLLLIDARKIFVDLFWDGGGWFGVYSGESLQPLSAHPRPHQHLLTLLHALRPYCGAQVCTRQFPEVHTGRHLFSYWGERAPFVIFIPALLPLLLSSTPVSSRLVPAHRLDDASAAIQWLPPDSYTLLLPDWCLAGLRHLKRR